MSSAEVDFAENENVKMRASKLGDRYDKIVTLADDTTLKLQQNSEGKPIDLLQNNRKN